MADFSFEKYIGQAFNGNGEDFSLIYDEAGTSPALTILQETAAVAKAMEASGVPYIETVTVTPGDTAAGSETSAEPVDIKPMLSGWLLPAPQAAAEALPAGPPSVLGRDGSVYYYVLDPSVVISMYRPQQATPLHDELIRFGLAGLVVEHELDLPGDGTAV